MLVTSRAAALIALTVLLTACGKESTTPGAPGVTSRKVVVSATARGTAGGASARAATSPPNIARIAPCISAHVEAVIAPGEASSEQIWNSGIVVTNRGTTPCTLQGASKIEFYPLSIKEVTTAGDPQALVSLKPGEQATMHMVVHTTAAKPVPTDCLEGVTSAQLTLPGDTKPIEARLPDRSQSLPPVCGAIEVSPWAKGSGP